MTPFDKAWGVLKALPEQRVDLISPRGNDYQTHLGRDRPPFTLMNRGGSWGDAEPSRTIHSALNPNRKMGKVDPRMLEGGGPVKTQMPRFGSDQWYLQDGIDPRTKDLPLEERRYLESGELVHPEYQDPTFLDSDPY